MYDPLAYKLLFPWGKDGWDCAQKQKDSKGNSRKVSPMKFYSLLLFQRTCDFNVLFHPLRLFQNYLCYIFVKVDSERLSWLSYNQSKLRASYYTHLYDLLTEAANHSNEINQWTGNMESNTALNVGRSVVLSSNHGRSNCCYFGLATESTLRKGP